ncbi:transmembrane protein, putative (macronuclear) [Tetrahymena thermophila SB210]|uniref:Transmembrane protein, putative n=1 Tax=Tetrahymena thermophila (strain SB210) TaxID=312017 RepID=Q23R71_TETTS|nr:transmembrane protein, putative [Tetrahymena thermophila SB210]EAR99177.2 transmembrane protein, putative [Tetrahymena thermophila SB210]|eukprot:XP_001019422.2 transmembrane protein, putative [Tetrahymena thermophila SB210]
MMKIANSILILFILISITYSIKNYKLPANFQTEFDTFLSKYKSDSISKNDVIKFVSPILRGTVERHDRELMSAISRKYFNQTEELMLTKDNLRQMVIKEKFETFINDFAMNMYKHLVQLYDIEDDITEADFERMVEDPELYGFIWEDYLIMTENVEELLIETEYDQSDLDRAVNELTEQWKVFESELTKEEQQTQQKKTDL